MKEQKADLSVFDFDEGDEEARPRLMRRIKESFLSADRNKKQRKNWKVDQDWTPTPTPRNRTSRVINASPSAIGSRTRSALREKNDIEVLGSTKAALPVQTYKNLVTLDSTDRKQKDKEMAETRKQKQKQMMEDVEEARMLLQKILALSRSCQINLRWFQHRYKSRNLDINLLLHTLVFPQDDPDPVTITTNDIDVLRPGAFLNDTIIDFYIKYLQTTLSETEKEKTYFFNSFFFPKLMELSSLSDEDATSAFARLEKWTKEVDVFAKDYIFVPVNRSSHWSLVVVCHLNDMKDIDPDIHTSSTCILHFDSFEGFHSDIERFIRNYLSQEWKRRRTNEHEQLQYQFDQIKFIKVKVPQQDNLHDCGLFLLHYVEMFLERGFNCPRGRFSFINKDWFDPGEASAKRKQLLVVLHDMYMEKVGASQTGSSRRKGSRGKPSQYATVTYVDDDDEEHDEELVMFHG